MTTWLASGVTVALLMLGLALSIPVLVLVVQTLGYLLVRNRVCSEALSVGQRPRIAVLVPAHDEALGIARTVREVNSQLRHGDRVLVVADNCTDDTAVLAQQAGAEVIERFDTQRRGKGYALDFGVRHLALNPPDVVVVVDADCIVAPGALGRLAEAVAGSGRPVQARYRMELSDSPALSARVAAFAWFIKSHVRPLGCHALSVPCQLGGTGMAVPWELMRGAKLASASIVEDIQLGIDLALTGYPPRYLPSEGVTSTFPITAAGIAGQRRRWEHGHLSMIALAIPRLLREALRRGRTDLLAIALDLSVPPLTLLVLGGACVLLLNALWSFVVGFHLGLVFSLFAVLALISAVLCAWLTGGYRVLPTAQLLQLPNYVAGKLPMYWEYLRGQAQRKWVRADRDGTN